jgi:hypothetical protein
MKIPIDREMLDFLFDHPHVRVVLSKPFGAAVYDFSDGMCLLARAHTPRDALAGAVAAFKDGAGPLSGMPAQPVYVPAVFLERRKTIDDVIEATRKLVNERGQALDLQWMYRMEELKGE